MFNCRWGPIVFPPSKPNPYRYYPGIQVSGQRHSFEPLPSSPPSRVLWSPCVCQVCLSSFCIWSVLLPHFCVVTGDPQGRRSLSRNLTPIGSRLSRPRDLPQWPFVFSFPDCLRTPCVFCLNRCLARPSSLVYPEIPSLGEQVGFLELVRPVPTLVQFFISFFAFKLQHIF